ncbi:MBL fold metallo-hydrolase [Gallaecimonas sp. GXIMD1310]|uniref:MBL fold metallo-hydrolase n=1 Tax=Gallaecimonas sp. GXIMD1310 TaxID=3131926 RepID=UPI00325524EF
MMFEPRFTVGKACISRVTETCFELSREQLYPDHTTIPTCQFEISIHSWLLQVDGLNILIDTGIGNHKERPFSALFHRLHNPYLERLQAAQVTTHDIDYVLLTHLHTDHLGWNTVLQDGIWQPTFPNARYLVPEQDLAFFFSAAGHSRRQLFDDSILPLILTNQLQVVPAAGAQVLPGIHFIPSPGHCAGHMTIALESQGETAYFCGDIMHNAIQVAAPEVNSGFCANPALATHTRKAFLAQAASKQALVLPAHFRESSAGRISIQEGHFHWHYVRLDHQPQ